MTHQDGIILGGSSGPCNAAGLKTRSRWLAVPIETRLRGILGRVFVSKHCLAEREQTGEASSKAKLKLMVQHCSTCHNTESRTHHVTPSIELLRDERPALGSNGREM